MAAHVCETHLLIEARRDLCDKHTARGPQAHSAESRWSRPDVAGASTVPVQMWQGRAQSRVQMWLGRAQSRVQMWQE